MIKKLKYTDKESALADFELKEITSDNVQGLIEIGLIPNVDGYHYDIMLEQDIDFGENEIQVNNPYHKFFGIDE
jgi:hypothetical protein